MLGVVRESLTCNTNDGVSFTVQLYRPSDVNLARRALIAGIVIVDTQREQGHWDEVMYRYATHGFAVLVYTSRRQTRLEDIFAQTEVDDLLAVHAYVRSQLQWVNPEAMFVLGKSYASGGVLRCLASKENAFIDGIVLTPIPFVSSLVCAEDTTTVPLASHLATALVLTEMGVASVVSRTTPSDLRARQLLRLDDQDRQTHDLTNLDVPLYTHINMHTPLVNNQDMTQIFTRLYTTQPESCIRFVHGSSDLYSTSIADDVYDDVLQWCRAILHQGSIQTYRTEVCNTTSGLGTYSSINPMVEERQYVLTDITTISLSTYTPMFLCTRRIDCLLQDLATSYLPPRPLLYLQRDILWQRVFTRSLDIAGFPAVTLFVNTTTPDSAFCMTLVVYDRRGYGQRLCSKYFMLKDAHSSTDPVAVRLPMLAYRIRQGQELVLVVSNYDPRFTYTGRTDATITFTNISLPYLFEY